MVLILSPRIALIGQLCYFVGNSHFPVPLRMGTLYLRLPCKFILCGACYYLLVLNLDCPVQVTARVLVLFHQKLDCRIIVIGFNAIYYGFYCVSSCVVNQYRLNQVHICPFWCSGFSFPLFDVLIIPPKQIFVNRFFR